MSVSKETANAVAKELQTVITEVLAKHGLSAPKVSIGYGEWFDMKIVSSALTLGPNGVNLTSKEATYYTKFGHTYYKSEGDFEGTELKAPLGMLFGPDMKYAFAGIDSKKRKNPIVALDTTTGKIVFFEESIVTRLNFEAIKQGAPTDGR
jgi:hypothetical protein